MTQENAQDDVFSSIQLPCGRTLRNRLVKVAMYEHLANHSGGPPNEHHFRLYSQWAKYDWGMVITGNVQVSSSHLTLGRDITLPEHVSQTSIKPFRALSSSIRLTGSNSTLAIMQLSHAGRQSPNIIGGRPPFYRPLGPSAVGVRAKDGGWLSDILHSIAFQTPREMSSSEINDVVEAFVKGAQVAFDSGFDGVQLHVAHGYLLAQFLSPKSNKRSDEYGVGSSTVLAPLHRIVLAIRARLPKAFVLGIKINSSDYVGSTGSLSNADTEGSRALNHIYDIASWCLIDFIEISGGDYEKPDFIVSESPYKSSRQALFARFSKQAVSILESSDIPSHLLPLILLTGGLRTPELLHTALYSKHAHLLGIGRSSVTCPSLPNIMKSADPGGPLWNQPFRPEPDLEAGLCWPAHWLRSYVPRIPLVGAGVEMAWYVVMIRRLASLAAHQIEGSLEPDYRVGSIGAVFRMWVWVDRRQLMMFLALSSLVIGILIMT